MKKFSIAIDGPAGAGKSTIARQLAKMLDCVYIDTGAMYRTVGYYCLINDIDCSDEDAVNERLEDICIELKYQNNTQYIYLNNKDVSDAIRTEEVSAAASKVATLQKVREALVAMQRKMQQSQSIVMDGRDIGTVVLPEATIKVFLTATVEERARRRMQDYAGKNIPANYEEVLQDISARDHQDYTRKVSPLQKAKDAVEIDTTSMTKDEVIETIAALLKQRIA